MNFLAHSHAPHLLLPFLLYKLWSPPVQAALRCFPDICSTFPFCVAGKGSGMEKALPRPLWPHGKGGEQSVRSPPATVGHICGQISPCCSLRRSAARPASALCCFLPTMFLTVSHMHKSENWSQEQPEKMHFLLTHYVSPFFLSQTIYTDGVDTWKGITPLQEWRGRIWPHQQSGSPLPVTLWPEWMTSIHWLPLAQTHTHSKTRGKGNTHTHTLRI